MLASHIFSAHALARSLTYFSGDAPFVRQQIPSCFAGRVNIQRGYQYSHSCQNFREEGCLTDENFRKNWNVH